MRRCVSHASAISSSMRPPPGGWLVVTAAPYSATGNGTTDDRAAIQAAIDAAAAGGIKTVYFPRTANFYGIGGVLNYKTGVRLRGASAITAAIVNLHSRSNSDTTMLQPNIADGSVTGVTIERLTIHQSGDYFDATFGDSTTQLCISIETTHNTIIQDCYFRYVRTMAVWCDSFPAHPTTGHQFLRNHIFQAGGDGVSYFGAFTGFSVNDNIIESCEDDAIAFQATLPTGSNGQPANGEARRNQLLNNTGRTDYGSTPHGILIQGGLNITVANNNVLNVFSTGVHMFNFDHWALSGITVDSNTINGTHVGYPGVGPAGAPGDGIWLSGAGTNPITITNNTMTNIGTGYVAVAIAGSTNVTRSGNSPPP